MHNNNVNNSVLSNGPEPIDFIDILIKLWRGKAIIFSTIAITLILALSYIFLAQEKWTSTAIITHPDAGQIHAYTHALDVIYGTNAPKINDTQYAIIQRFSSSFSALSESLDNKSVPEKLTIEEAVKGQGLPLKVTYRGHSAENAQKTLAQYIQQVDDEVSKGIASDLATTIKLRQADLQQSLETQERVVKEQKNLRIAQITQSLVIAQQSNIKTPQVQQAEQVSQDTMFLLGSDALSSMVRNEANRPLPFTDSYYQTRQSLFDVTNLMIGENSDDIKADSLHAYRYVMKPNLPIHRDSPKRVLTIILAIFIGAVIGSGIILCRIAINNYRSAQ
ncbi:LPS O-antigen chain length determinant protein WzzB [Pluralibacter gergoviae]|nr:LPS O-antigen chain length determinant protein WzzB [Pluralibacter gergoviae]ELW9443385.1 LPS O-antigen chain length determinant protein WzzB [Pluralibacter gergoviae]